MHYLCEGPDRIDIFGVGAKDKIFHQTVSILLNSPNQQLIDPY